MAKYITRRLLLGLIVLMGVILITFFMTRVLPTDPALKWAGMKATPEQVQAARIELGLDKPIYAQFVSYFSDLLHGNLGTSYVTRKPVLSELKEAIPATLELVFYSSVLATILGTFLGIHSARKKNKLTDHLVRFFFHRFGVNTNFCTRTDSAASFLQLAWNTSSGRKSKHGYHCDVPVA